MDDAWTLSNQTKNVNMQWGHKGNMCDSPDFAEFAISQWLLALTFLMVQFSKIQIIEEL